jgi:hypothetical protein
MGHRHADVSNGATTSATLKTRRNNVGEDKLLRLPRILKAGSESLPVRLAVMLRAAETTHDCTAQRNRTPDISALGPQAPASAEEPTFQPAAETPESSVGDDRGDDDPHRHRGGAALMRQTIQHHFQTAGHRG